MKIIALNPTLWRTCKMLAGVKRIQLLRQLDRLPGQSVVELGRAVGIKRSDASQELRRIQSRGILKSRRLGTPLIYRMEPDPQVATAAPLLKAIQSAFSSQPAERDAEMCRLAEGLAHERRIALARILQKQPRSFSELHGLLHIPMTSLAWHLRELIRSGFVVHASGSYHFNTPSHPLARVLARLIAGS
jgi:DNA-binding MarR family transcriptional regulator